jgi:hypothetical protein
MRVGTSKMARQNAVSSSPAFDQQWQVAGERLMLIRGDKCRKAVVLHEIMQRFAIILLKAGWGIHRGPVPVAIPDDF